MAKKRKRKTPTERLKQIREIMHGIAIRAQAVNGPFGDEKRLMKDWEYEEIWKLASGK